MALPGGIGSESENRKPVPDLLDFLIPTFDFR